MSESTYDLDSLKKWVSHQIIPGAMERDRSYKIPIDLYQQLFDLGWWTSFVPLELGGAGLSTYDLCEVAKSIAYGSPGMATSFTANTLALVVLSRFAEESVKQALFKKVTSELSFSSFCFTEPDSGSDVLSIKTCAKRALGGYLLNGSKCFITNANYAQHFVVLAQLEGASDPKKSISAFYVPVETAGISTGKPLRKMGQRDSNTSEVFFQNVFIPQCNLIGKEGEGMKIAAQSLQTSRVLLAASAVGLCERASDLVKDHLSKRILYSKPLLEQPTIRCFLAQLHAEMKATWYLALAAAQNCDNGNYQMELSSMAKLMGGQLAVRFSHGVMELFGGWGYSEEFEIERIYRDAKILETLEGPTFVQQTIIAKEIFPRIERRLKSETLFSRSSLEKKAV